MTVMCKWKSSVLLQKFNHSLLSPKRRRKTLTHSIWLIKGCYLPQRDKVNSICIWTHLKSRERLLSEIETYLKLEQGTLMSSRAWCSLIVIGVCLTAKSSARMPSPSKRDKTLMSTPVIWAHFKREDTTLGPSSRQALTSKRLKMSPSFGVWMISLFLHHLIWIQHHCQARGFMQTTTHHQSEIRINLCSSLSAFTWSQSPPVMTSLKCWWTNPNQILSPLATWFCSQRESLT